VKLRPIVLTAIGLIVVGALTTRDLMVPLGSRWVPIGGVICVGPLALPAGGILLWYILTEDANKATKRTLLLGAVLGSLAGPILVAGLRFLSLFADVGRRLQSARTGGGGESVLWAEPLLYIFAFLPIAILGAIVGMLLAAWFKRLRVQA
jgi:hypothetical protein